MLIYKFIGQVIISSFKYFYLFIFHILYIDLYISLLTYIYLIPKKNYIMYICIYFKK